MKNEVRMLAHVRHPNVVLLMGVCTKPSPELSFVFELATKGSLFDALHGGKLPLSGNVRLRIARDIACAMAFLHASGIVHRALKSQNVLLDE